MTSSGGFLMLDNRLIDQGFWRVSLTERETKIILYIIRNTYRRKSGKPYSTKAGIRSQMIAQATGMNDADVRRTLARLISRNIVQRQEDGPLILRPAEEWSASVDDKFKRPPKTGGEQFGARTVAGLPRVADIPQSAWCSCHGTPPSNPHGASDSGSGKTSSYTDTNGETPDGAPEGAVFVEQIEQPRHPLRKWFPVVQQVAAHGKRDYILPAEAQLLLELKTSGVEIYPVTLLDEYLRMKKRRPLAAPSAVLAAAAAATKNLVLARFNSENGRRRGSQESDLPADVIARMKALGDGYGKGDVH